MWVKSPPPRRSKRDLQLSATVVASVCSLDLFMRLRRSVGDESHTTGNVALSMRPVFLPPNPILSLTLGSKFEQQMIL